MTSGDWTAIAAIATGAGSIATAVMAVATFLLARQTRRSADAAREAAQAASEQVGIERGTLELLRHERELRLRPWLVPVAEGVVPVGKPLTVDEALYWGPIGRAALFEESSLGPVAGLVVEVANVGSGAAVDVLLAHNENGLLRWSREPVTIGSHESRLVLLLSAGPGAPPDPPPDLFTLRSPAGERTWTPARRVYVMACRDETGDVVYRFANGSPGFDEWRRGQPVVTWAHGLRRLAPWLDLEPVQENEES